MTAQAIYDRQERYDRRYQLMRDANKVQPLVLKDSSPMPQSEYATISYTSDGLWRIANGDFGDGAAKGILAEIAELTENND